MVAPIVSKSFIVLLSMLGIICGVASCSTQPTGVEHSLKGGSSYSPLAVPNELRARPIYFDKLVLNLPANEKYGEVKVGIFCEKSRELVWDGSSSVLRESDVRNAFNETLDRFNYSVIGKSDELFEDTSKTEIVVAGLVKELHISVCSRFNMNLLLMPLMRTNETKVSATASIKVNWRAYDVGQRRVVYETSTEGPYDDALKTSTIRGILIAVFRRAVEGLIADKAFFDLVLKENAKM